jgi:HK97 family phage major capsid protein
MKFLYSVCVQGRRNWRHFLFWLHNECMSEKQIPESLPVMYRTGTVDAPPPKDGERLSGPDPGRFRFKVSSETPVRRWFGNEILDHDKKSVRTNRLDAGAVPALLNHSQRFGKVDKYELKNGELTVEGPFSRSAFAQECRQDYDDGILVNSSVGYQVHKMVRTEDEDNPTAPDECRVMDWEPIDASLVDVPADASVGVGRTPDQSKNFPVIVETIRRRSAGTAEPVASTDPAPAAQPQPEPQQEKRSMADTAVGIDSAALELARRNDIMAVATDQDFRKYTTIDEAQEAIAKGTTASAFRDTVSRKICQANAADKVGTAGSNLFTEMDKSDQKRFSIFRLVRALTEAAKPNSFSRSACDARLEFEYSDELKKRLKISTDGPLVPELGSLRALGTSGISSGAGQIAVTAETGALATYTRPEVIELLRNRPRVEQLGARRLGGLQGVIRLPRQSGAGTASWVTEGGAVSPADLTMDFISLTPHRISAQTAWTVELLAETAPDVEALARGDQDAIIRLALDLAAISGSGTSGQPMGLMNTTGLTLLVPSGTAFSDGGKPLTFNDVLAFETTVSAANADAATSAFLFTPEVRGQLKGTPKFAAGLANPIWDDGPKDPLGIDMEGPLGYRAGVTNQLAKNGTHAGVTGSILHNAIFGDWSQMVVADWGAREIVVDPYTQAANGAVVVTQRALHDIGIRHIAAFVANPNIAIS